MTSLVAQMVKRLPTMQETWVQSLGREDLLEKEMTTHSSTLAWKIPWTKEPGRLQSMGSQRVTHDWTTSLSLLDILLISHHHKKKGDYNNKIFWDTERERGRPHSQALLQYIVITTPLYYPQLLLISEM